MMSARRSRARSLGGRASGGDVRFSGVSTDSRTLARGRAVRRAARRALRRPRLPRQAPRRAARPRRWSIAATRAICRCRWSWSTTRKLALGELARHWRARFRAGAHRGHRQQRQDHGEGDARVDPARATPATTPCSPPRQPQQRHRPAAHAAAPARSEHRWCAIELGMNHTGEIAYLAGIAQPTVALVNNAQREHLEFMNRSRRSRPRTPRVYEALPGRRRRGDQRRRRPCGVLSQPARARAAWSTSAWTRQRR